MLSLGRVFKVADGGPFPLPFCSRHVAGCRGGVRRLARQRRQRAATEAPVEEGAASLHVTARCHPGRIHRAEDLRRVSDAGIPAAQGATLRNVARAIEQLAPAPDAAEEFLVGASAELAQCMSIYDVGESATPADYDPEKLGRATAPVDSEDQKFA